MLSLTVWQPWASLIVGSPPTDVCPGAPPQKTIENRDKRPWQKAIGQRIAIHAGLESRRNLDAFHSVFRAHDFGPVIPPYRTPGDFPLGAVVGVATLDRVIGPLPETLYKDRLKGISTTTIASWGLAAGDLRWFVGSWGWVLRDRQHIADPVPCRGDRGLWELPDDVERAVVAQIARAA